MYVCTKHFFLWMMHFIWLGFSIVLAYDLVDVTGPWKCRPNTCWAHPFSRLYSFLLAFNLFEFWNCEPCITLVGECQVSYHMRGSGQDRICEEFSIQKLSDNCQNKNIPLYISDNTLSFNDVFFLGPLRQKCDFLQNCQGYCQWSDFSCASGVTDSLFYGHAFPQYLTKNNLGQYECRNCLQISGVFCEKGSHPVRCIQTYVSPRCEQCVYPPLSNSTVFRYGTGFLFEDCEQKIQNYEDDYGENDDINDVSFWKGCAWFLTPKWNTGYCKIECNKGYTWTNSPQNLFAEPTCILCETNCGKGYMTPPCQGGTGQRVLEDNDGKCISCASQGVLLPLNGEWVGSGALGTECQWGCKKSYYWNDDLGECVLCPFQETDCKHDTTQKNYGADSYYMKCTNNSKGECVYCFRTCANAWLDIDISANECLCRPCSQPTLGKTFISVPCGSGPEKTLDSVLSNCTKPESCMGGFIFKNCTLDQDMICLPCTPPVPGKLLVRKCTLYADALYTDCPQNYACNGTALIRSCPSDRIALNGFCMCPPGKEFSEVNLVLDPNFLSVYCVLKKCSNNFYMDSVSQSCLSCRPPAGEGEILALSDADVLGIEACYCPKNYFPKRVVGTTYVKCWPCGDLMCPRSLFQKQTACGEKNIYEPECECLKLPGVNYSFQTDKDKYTVSCQQLISQCSEGYESHLQNSLTNINLYNDKFTFVYKRENEDLASFRLPMDSTFSQSFQDRKIQKVLFLSSSNYLLVHSENNESSFLTMVHHSKESEKSRHVDIPLQVFIDIGAPLRISKLWIQKIILHAREDSAIPTSFKNAIKVWIVFSYTGWCGEGADIGDETKILQHCSSMELITFSSSFTNWCNIPVLEFCMQFVKSYWGGTVFAQWGHTELIHDASLGNLEERDHSMYFLLSSSAHGKNILARYLLYFHNNDYINYEDSIVHIQILSPVHGSPLFFSIQSIMVGIRGILGVVIINDQPKFRFKFSRKFFLVFWPFDFVDSLVHPHDFPLLPAYLWNHAESLQVFNMDQLALEQVNSFLQNDGSEFLYSFKRVNYHLVLLEGGSISSSFVLDLWNHFASTYTDFGDFLSVDGFSTMFFSTFIQYMYFSRDTNSLENIFQFMVLEMIDQDKWLLHKIGNLIACNSDYALFPVWFDEDAGEKQCIPLPCKKLASCGPNSNRNTQSENCQCDPGHYVFYKPPIFSYPLDSAVNNKFSYCKKCPVGYYCPGNFEEMQSCPVNSRTSIQKSLSVSVFDCLCDAGYFMYERICVACIQNTFCPFPGTLIPSTCIHGGETSFNMRTNPLDCVCPVRTHGFSCVPCTNEEICLRSEESMHQKNLMQVNVYYYGYFHSLQNLQTCLSKTSVEYLLYVIPVETSTYLQNLNLKENVMSNYAWSWILILNAKDGYIMGNLLFCVQENDFLFSAMNNEIRNPSYRYEIAAYSFRTNMVRIRRTCDEISGQPGMWEWNGLTIDNEEACVCKGGYEALVSYFSGNEFNLKCFPCLNGTHRPPKHSSLQCLQSCPYPEREHAPYLGMSYCICRPGYIFNQYTKKCETKEEIESFLPMNSQDEVENRPLWFDFVKEFNNFIIFTSVLFGVTVFLFFVFYYNLG
jgi:hypothetical protein